MLYVIIIKHTISENINLIITTSRQTYINCKIILYLGEINVSFRSNYNKLIVIIQQLIYENKIMSMKSKNLVAYYIPYYKISCFCIDEKISVRINLPLFSTVVPASIFMLCYKYTSWDDGGK